MSFSFGGAGGGSAFGSPITPQNPGAQIESGPDLEEILTENLGYRSLAGDAKVRLLSTPWPSDALPPPTSSLLSVASTKGLVAAAGPRQLVIASTDSVRDAFSAESSGDGRIKPITPQWSVSLEEAERLSQVAFTADETYLVISAQLGGGIRVYEVQAIMQGSTQPAFDLPTNGIALRALLPNPTPERASLVAIVTSNGDLMVINLQNRQWASGPTGPVLRGGVSCLSWSTKGKQLVAGMGDGSACQMTPEGEEKAVIPKPPKLLGNEHVSSISWLENNSFLTVHTPTLFDSDSAPESTFHIVTRQPPSTYGYQVLPDPCPPFGLNRSPAHHFMARLKNFPPHLQDMLIVASTASTDIGQFTKTATPFAPNPSPDKITGHFTMTTMADDTRRSQLPMTEELTDTSPIGVAIDLSSRVNIPTPIPGEEIDSSTPLPALMVLNNEGVLAAWWIVYSDAVRQGLPYPELVATKGQAQPQPVQPVLPAAPFGATTQQTPAFGQAALTESPSSAFGAFPKPATPSFGTQSTFGGGPSNAFGTPSALGGGTVGAFGASTGLGTQPSPWSKTAAPSPALQTGGNAFGKPAFGTPAALGTQSSSFGSTGGLGNRGSPWGGSTTLGLSGSPSPFGLAAENASKSGSVFGSTSNGASGGGFGNYADKGGFAAVNAQGNSGSVFAKSSTLGPAQGGDMDTDTSFGRPAETSIAPGIGSTPFTLGSTFKGDGTAKDDAPKPQVTKEDGLFGAKLGDDLVLSSSPRSTFEPAAPDLTPARTLPIQSSITEEAEMASKESAHSASSPATTSMLAPTTATTIAPSSFEGLYGGKQESGGPSVVPQTAQKVDQDGVPTVGVAQSKAPEDFPLVASPTDAKESLSDPIPTLEKHENLISPAGALPPSPKIKSEPEDGEENSPAALRDIPEAPLPPVPTSKASYALGDSSTSSIGTFKGDTEDAPLPPDFVAAKSEPQEVPEDAPLPPDFIMPKQTTIDPSLIPPMDVPGTPEREPSSLLEPSSSPLEDEGSDKLDEEGSGEDVAKDITPEISPESSFGGGSISLTGGKFTNISMPGSHQTARPLFGEIGSHSIPTLPPPTKVPESPRSPSPVRPPQIRNNLRPDVSRSASAPGWGMKPNGAQSAALGRSQPTAPIPRSSADKVSAGRQPQIQKPQLKDEEEELLDQRDEEVRRVLASEIQPTKTLPEFIAHNDYVGTVDKAGIPGQIERVYRDINSMIDTLGLNARALEAFVQGHEEFKESGRSREDLEDEDDWCLCEIPDLGGMVHELEVQLEDGRIKNVQEKIIECLATQKELEKLRIKHNDIKKAIDARLDPTQLAALRTMPLSAEQSLQQHDIREAFGKLQKLLAEVEEAITVLRAKLASQSGVSGKNGATAPTVENVMKTIMTMTGMIEKKSGDVDMLENQMRKLRFSSVDSRRSREGSPFATPQSKFAGSTRTPGSGATGPYFTPESRRGTPSRFGSSSMSPSPFSRSGTPVSQKLSSIQVEDVERVRAKMMRKRAVTTKLAEAVVKAGPRVKVMDE